MDDTTASSQIRHFQQLDNANVWEDQQARYSSGKTNCSTSIRCSACGSLDSFNPPGEGCATPVTVRSTANRTMLSFCRLRLTPGR